MPEVRFEVDVDADPEEQPMPVHNRWHPDIPAQVTAEPGERFRMECLDWTGGQIHDDDNANDVRDVDLDAVHYLSGPIEVEGAEPGDLLVMDILDIGVLNERWEYGFTGIFSQQNGGGFLTDHFPDASKCIWELEGTKTTSRHIPDVRFEEKIHPGMVGTAQSHDLLAEWNEREQDLIDKHEKDPSSIPDHPTKDVQPPVANAPTTNSAVMGGMDDDEAEAAAEEGARTVPPRENGGNCDIKDLSLGSRVYFPVYVDGGKLSMGDIHFSQGDGEITFCGAIEMAGWIDFRVDVIKGGMEKFGLDHAIFKPGNVEPDFSEYITFEGYSVDEDGKQHYKNANVGMRRACLDAIDYLKNFGYTGEQAYLSLSTIPVESRLAGVVDLPNTCVTVSVPQAAFDFDIDPDRLGDIKSKSRGTAARPS